MTRSLGYRTALKLVATGLCISACGLLPDSGADSDDDDDDDSSGGSKGGKPGGSGGSAGSNPTACRNCAEAACANEAQTCATTNGCSAIADCFFACDLTDSLCQANCVPTDAAGAMAYAAAAPYYSCAVVQCLEECSPSVGGNGGGGGVSGGASGSGAGGANTGGALPTGGTPSTGGTTGGSGPTGGVGGAGGSGPLTPGVHWLSIEGSWADISAEPNASLGVSGALYAFADSCAQITWDEATRCVTGTLCDPGATFANWGMAVGFDLRNTGADGVPANTKMPWNAGAVGAMGIAYQISGTAPGLQAWITNMDPVWNGMCTADDCAINGPPDGSASATLSSVGNLYFSTLVKDDWGGSGTIYTFNPANILSLQFKLASVVSGPVPFSFCVDRIGIII
jgi:hypothetical protein